MAGNKAARVSCTVADLSTLIRLRREAAAMRKEVADQAAEVEKQLKSHAELVGLARGVDLVKSRVAALNKQCQSETSAADEDRAAVRAARQELLPRAQRIGQAQKALLQRKRRLDQDLKQFPKLTTHLHAVEKVLVTRRSHLVRELARVYPISTATYEGKGHKVTNQRLLAIKGITLPNSDFVGYDEEEVATALGYTLHVVLMLSKYLDVPLRYPMTFLGSRSTLRDEVGTHANSDFPLYPKGSEKQRFDYAVFLLNKNIEQLLQSLGRYNVRVRDTLPNLQTLLQADMTTVKASERPGSTRRPPSRAMSGGSAGSRGSRGSRGSSGSKRTGTAS